MTGIAAATLSWMASMIDFCSAGSFTCVYLLSMSITSGSVQRRAEVRLLPKSAG